MVVEWARLEAQKADQIVEVDVSELKLDDGKGGFIKSLPAKDLTNEEFMRHQRDPMVVGANGSLTDFMSQKAQNFTLVITVARLIKGNPELKLTAQYIKEHWTTSRTLKLVGLISEAFGESEKNLSNLQSPTPDNSS